ncbi:MAG: hypothetical protein E7672_08170 [Ruminococcaceae bacterium]|nr:hypothetical protein [Oscillospiraceae bacterium]
MKHPKYSGGVIVNIDPNTVTWPFLERAVEEENFSEETLYPFVDQYADSNVKVLIFNNYCTASSTPSKVFTDEIEVYNRKYENGVEVDFKDAIKGLYKCIVERGIEPYGVWINRTRERGMEAWLSLRMNDNHGFIDDAAGRTDFYYEAEANGWLVGHNPNGSLGSGLNEIDFSDPCGGYSSHRLYNYAVPDVRQKFLDYIEEQLDMYNVDGIELDFMRNPICFDYTNCPEKTDIMNDFIRSVRKLADKAGEKNGHYIKVAARMPRDIARARTYGFDTETWSEEKLVDYIIPSPNYFSCDSDMDIAQWAERCPNIKFSIGFESLTHSRRGKFRMTSEDVINGMMAGYLAQGADSVYLYNYYIDPYKHIGIPEHEIDAYTKRNLLLLKRFDTEDDIYSHRRRHLITYEDNYTYGFERYQPLPAEISVGESKSFSLPIGYIPEGKKAEIVVGLAEGTPDYVTVSVNGKICVGLKPCATGKIESLMSATPGLLYCNKEAVLYTGSIEAESLDRYEIVIKSSENVVVDYIEFVIE